MRTHKLLWLPLLLSIGTIGIFTWHHPLHSHSRDHGVHPCEVDVPFGVFTAKEIAAMESLVPNSDLSSKTLADVPPEGPSSDVLTFVIDFKESGQPVTTDIFGFEIGEFEVADFGFSAGDFDLVANAILAEVFEDFFDELAGTIANQNGDMLEINFVIGDIGVAPVGVSEFYYIQVGSSVGDIGFLGVAGGGVVRNVSGNGPNSGIEVGDIVGTVVTDNIQGLGGLSPSNALSIGSLGFTTNAIAGTLSHEIGHTLSLSHVNSNQSIQPTPGRPPIMGTGAIDLSNQSRLSDREFSLAGFDQENGDVARFHIDRLVCALGPVASPFYYTGEANGDFFEASNWNDDPAGEGSSLTPFLIRPGFSTGVSAIGVELVIDGIAVVANDNVSIGRFCSGGLTLRNGARLEVNGSGNDLTIDDVGSFNLVESEVDVEGSIFLEGEIDLVGGTINSNDEIVATLPISLSIDGTDVIAFGNIDFRGSTSPVITGATFSYSGNGNLTISGLGAAIEVVDTSVVVGLEEQGFGDIFPLFSNLQAGTLVLNGSSSLIVNEVRNGANIQLFDDSTAVVAAGDPPGLGVDGSTIQLFSESSSLTFSSVANVSSPDRRDFVVNGVTGLSYSNDPVAWNIVDWNGQDAIVLQLAGETVLIGDVNLDGAVNLLDVAAFVDRVQTGTFQLEADINKDSVVNLLDVDGFVELLQAD